MPRLLVLLFSLAGLAVSAYLHLTKRRGQKPYCFLGQDCSSVINSRYSVTFGLPNEVLGIIYYLAVFLLYLSPLTQIPEVDLAAFVVSTLAAAFSSYLFYLQAHVLKKWCEWCLVSTICSLGIFLVLLF